ncbi:unnamed protein product [Vicia faba]|uniref:Uncharacterized protein n=1 Tax=Vicia faba TaxID=3906 RepID=A0AAV1B1L8_VICFA|nr:unnamed protein product [Vicia faba]
MDTIVYNLPCSKFLLQRHLPLTLPFSHPVPPIKPDGNKYKSKEPTVKNKGFGFYSSEFQVIHLVFETIGFCSVNANAVRNIYTVVAFCAGNKVYLQTTNELFESIFWRSKKMTVFDAECCIEGISNSTFVHSISYCPPFLLLKLDIPRTLEYLHQAAAHFKFGMCNWNVPCWVDTPEECASLIEANIKLKLGSGTLIGVLIPQDNSTSGHII